MITVSILGEWSGHRVATGVLSNPHPVNLTSSSVWRRPTQARSLPGANYYTIRKWSGDAPGNSPVTYAGDPETRPTRDLDIG